MPPGRRVSARADVRYPDIVAKRSVRILRRVLIALAILAVLLVAGFTWFAYWPLEGDVERIDGLIPADVDFAYKVSIHDVKGSAWARRNFLEGSAIPPLADARKALEDLSQRLEE